MNFQNTNKLFIQKLINMTLNNELKWEHLREDMFSLFDIEFCLTDYSNSFYADFEGEIVLLLYGSNNNSISCVYHLFIAKTSDSGYIAEILISDEGYTNLAELSYHIKGR